MARVGRWLGIIVKFLLRQSAVRTRRSTCHALNYRRDCVERDMGAIDETVTTDESHVQRWRGETPCNRMQIHPESIDRSNRHGNRSPES